MLKKIQNVTDRQTRQVCIDLLESIAILLVLLYHCITYKYDFLSNESPLYYFRYLFNTLLSTCVPLFFFANGYLLLNKSFCLKKHVFKTIRLIILAVVWGIVIILIQMPIKNKYLSFAEIIKTLWSLDISWRVNLIWFLGALVCIYIFFPLLKLVYDSNKKIFLYFVIVCAIMTFGNILLNEIGTIFLSKILHKSITLQGFNFFNMFNPFRGIYGYAFVYFCIGGYMYHLKDILLNINSRKRNILTILTMAVCCLCLWGVGIYYSTVSGKIWDVVWNGYDTIFTFINVICIYVLCLNLNKDIKIIRTISCSTLGIYFIHTILIAFTKRYIWNVSFLCNIPCNILYAIAILFVSLIITLIIRKIPILKKLV